MRKRDFMDLDNPLLAWMLDYDAVSACLRVGGGHMSWGCHCPPPSLSCWRVLVSHVAGLCTKPTSGLVQT